MSHSPPPPYSPHIQDSDRVRGIRLSQSNMKSESPVQLSQMISGEQHKTGSSIASNSSNNSNQNTLPK